MRFGKPTKRKLKNNPRYFSITENMKMENNSNRNMHDVQFYLEEFYPFAKEALGFDEDATVVFESDLKNSKDPLGKTAHYNPANNTVTVYVDSRHPKDVMRSVSHELVHHAQNLRGDLNGGAMEEGYAQSDDHLRKMEEEAYRKGNMIFRDWTDTRNNPEEQKNIMSRLMQEWGYDDSALEEEASNSKNFEEGQLVVVIASALAVDGEKTGTVVKSDDKSVTIKLDDDQEGKHVPEDKMVRVRIDYVEPRAEAGDADIMGETEEVNEMYDDDFDMDSLEDEFPWLKKDMGAKKGAPPADVAADLDAEFGDMMAAHQDEEEEEPLSEEDYDTQKDSDLVRYGRRRGRRTKDSFGNRIPFKPKKPSAEKEEEEEITVMKEDPMDESFRFSDEEKAMLDKMSKKEFSDYVTKGRHTSPDLKGDMGELPGMEGPFQYKSGAVLYYDTKTGEYYDRGQDRYLDRDEAAELTMEKVDRKKAAWMKAYDDAAGNPQPKPRDFWDTATFLYNKGEDPVEAGQRYSANNINEAPKTWAEAGAEDAKKGRPPSPPSPGGLGPDRREWNEYMEAYKAAAGQTVGGPTGAHMNEMEGDGGGWGEDAPLRENWGATMDKAQSVLGYEPELEQTGDGYVLNLDGPLDEVDEDGLMMVFPNGRKLDDTTFSTGISPHMNEVNKQGDNTMKLEEMVRQAVRKALTEKKHYRREDEKEDEMKEGLGADGREFNVGDMVQVTGGRLEGATGEVVEFAEGKAVVRLETDAYESVFDSFSGNDTGEVIVRSDHLAPMGGMNEAMSLADQKIDEIYGYFIEMGIPDDSEFLSLLMQGPNDDQKAARMQAVLDIIDGKTFHASLEEGNQESRTITQIEKIGDEVSSVMHMNADPAVADKLELIDEMITALVGQMQGVEPMGMEETKSSEKYDDDPALKGDQDELPDHLQKAIIDDEEEKVDETTNKEWYDSQLFEGLMQKWAK